VVAHVLIQAWINVSEQCLIVTCQQTCNCGCAHAKTSPGWLLLDLSKPHLNSIYSDAEWQKVQALTIAQEENLLMISSQINGLDLQIALLQSCRDTLLSK